MTIAHICSGCLLTVVLAWTFNHVISESTIHCRDTRTSCNIISSSTWQFQNMLANYQAPIHHPADIPSPCCQPTTSCQTPSVIISLQEDPVPDHLPAGIPPSLTTSLLLDLPPWPLPCFQTISILLDHMCCQTPPSLTPSCFQTIFMLLDHMFCQTLPP